MWLTHFAHGLAKGQKFAFLKLRWPTVDVRSPDRTCPRSTCSKLLSKGQHRYGGVHWRNLANTTEPSVCGSDAALSNYFDHLLLLVTGSLKIWSQLLSSNRRKWKSVKCVIKYNFRSRSKQWNRWKTVITMSMTYMTMKWVRLRTWENTRNRGAVRRRNAISDQERTVAGQCQRVNNLVHVGRWIPDSYVRLNVRTMKQ